MPIESDKHKRFMRLAKLRGERLLKHIQLLGNLSNRNNYEYSQKEVQILFSAIENELRHTKSKFERRQKKGIHF